MAGFIGSTCKGVTTTLGRGGSDLTASLVGAGISADEIQIWTDVDGMLTCDPRVLAGGYRMREIGYEEAAEMARCGAKVLCPTSIEPALRQRIPIVIRNSRRPEVEGTRVVSKPRSAPGIVKCITCKVGMSVVHLRVGNRGMLSSITDGLADLFARAHVSVDLIQASQQGISFAVSNWPGLPEVLRKVDECVEIAVEEDRAAIWLVGEGIASGETVLRRALGALNATDVRLISQGSSSQSLGIAVPESDLRLAVEALHAEFFAAPDRDVFAAPELAPLDARQPTYRQSHMQLPLGSQAVPAH
jgi:aspartate kinase